MPSSPSAYVMLRPATRSSPAAAKKPGVTYRSSTKWATRSSSLCTKRSVMLYPPFRGRRLVSPAAVTPGAASAAAASSLENATCDAASP